MSKVESTDESATRDVDDVTSEYSWRHMIDVDRWAGSCADTTWEYFEARVLNMPSEKHLERALQVEVARDQPRPERVGLINQRLAEIRGGSQ